MTARRELLIASGLAALGAVLPALAQKSPEGPPRRIAVFAGTTRENEAEVLKSFFGGMRELGWIEGRSVIYEHFYAESRFDRLPALAADVVARKPDLIWAPGTTTTLAAARATRSIPIVFATTSDPVTLGIVKSLARPGGNVTGMAGVGSNLMSSKRLQLLREMLPGARRVGILIDNESTLLALREGARKLGLTVTHAGVPSPEQLEPAMHALLKGGAEIVLVAETKTTVFFQRKQMLEIAAKAKRPVIAAVSGYADDGALGSYGPDIAAQIGRSATIVDKILRGAKPADIPVEQPTKFELVVNLKTAKALGLKVPQSVLLRSDRVIE